MIIFLLRYRPYFYSESNTMLTPRIVICIFPQKNEPGDKPTIQPGHKTSGLARCKFPQHF